MGTIRAHMLNSISGVVLSIGLVGMATASDAILVAPKPDWVTLSELKSTPDDVSGLAFMRRNDVRINLTQDGQETFVSQRIRILDSRALDLGNIGLSWNPASGPPSVHGLTIYRGDETINVLAENEFEIIRREDQLERARLDGILTATLRVPDLRVGDEIEWSYTAQTHDPTLGAESSGLLPVAPLVIPGRHSLVLQWEPGQKPAIQMTDDLADIANQSRDQLSISIDDPDIIRPPKDAPPRYNWARMVEYSDFESWPEVSQRFSSLYEIATILSDDSAVKVEAARIAKVHADPKDRAAAALELVQQQVRYIYVGLNGGNISPATADEVWELRYGDCKGKTVLLMALLNELGIKSQAVLVNNQGLDDGFDERLPTPQLFDHVIVQAKIDGTTLWMDGTLPDVIGPSRHPFLPYRWVLPLSNFGSVMQPASMRPYELPQEMGLFEIDARAGFGKSAPIAQTHVKRGVEGLAEYMQLSALSAKQIDTAYRNALLSSEGWDTIDTVTYRYDRDTQASITTFTGTGLVDWDYEGDDIYDLSLPRGGDIPPEKRQRVGVDGKTDDIPYYQKRNYTCHVTTVRLPEDTDIENWSYNSTIERQWFGRIYYRAMERRDDHTIRMVRGSRVNHPEITADHAWQHNQRLRAFDNSMAVITYDPTEFSGSQFETQTVPATYEIDWTGADVPCLPEGKRRVIETSDDGEVKIIEIETNR